MALNFDPQIFASHIASVTGIHQHTWPLFYDIFMSVCVRVSW
jgi:hypothetical protein